MKSFSLFKAWSRADLAVLALLALPLSACSEKSLRFQERFDRPSIVLVTLDTVRADALGHEGGQAETPFLDALAREGVRFEHAYTTAPMTLPAHTSMLTGLYPAAHDIHENGRRISDDLDLLAERLEEHGYATAAFVSGFPLARRFGLDRGFDHYDDDFGTGVERSAAETTERVLRYLGDNKTEPMFVWVHYYDAHEPYLAPEPFGSRWKENPYYGEVSYVDVQLGRLIEAVRRDLNQPVLIVVGDHGESLGDHGELRHGNLLYQSVMRVPLLVSGPTLDAMTVSTAVSTRRVFHTILGLAGGDPSGSLLDQAGVGSAGNVLPGEVVPSDVVIAEAMKPFLQYGWQPQVMAVSGRTKAIRSGDTVEIYDVVSDPTESKDLAPDHRLDPAILEALRTYPLPSLDSVEGAGLDADERKKLAALGYFSSNEIPTHRLDVPRARDMTHLFADLDRGSGLFVQERWRESISVFEKIVDQDPDNLMVNLRLAVAHSLDGRRPEAERYFEWAERIDPDSVDRRRYLALHHCRFGDLDRAESLLGPLLPRLGGSIAALECLSEIRLRQGRFDEAARLLARVAALQPDSAAIRERLGEARMAAGETQAAIDAFEAARGFDPAGFDRHLELGVLYLAARNLEPAVRELESVPPTHPGYPMALFKRAQVSVLRGEPDRGERVRLAYRHANATTRSLIASESLFRGIRLD